MYVLICLVADLEPEIAYLRLHVYLVRLLSIYRELSLSFDRPESVRIRLPLVCASLRAFATRPVDTCRDSRGTMQTRGSLSWLHNRGKGSICNGRIVRVRLHKAPCGLFPQFRRMAKRKPNGGW